MPLSLVCDDGVNLSLAHLGELDFRNHSLTLFYKLSCKRASLVVANLKGFTKLMAKGIYTVLSVEILHCAALRSE